MTTEHWLSIVDYARMFNISDMTVRRRIKAGRLPAKLIDQKYYIAVPQSPPNTKLPQMHSPQPVQRQEPSYTQTQPQHVPNPIKNHPQAQRTFNLPDHQHVPLESIAYDTQNYPQEDSSLIPTNLKRPLIIQESSLVDTRALLAFCEATMRKMGDLERRQTEKFKAKLETLEANLDAKNFEIRSLRQQLEDLQLLVKFLDEKRR